MLIPIRHENMSARRWPVVTFGLIALNTVIFLFTHYGVERPSPGAAQVPAHILLLAADHPELSMPPEIQHIVKFFQERAPEFWASLRNPDRPNFDAWEAQFRAESDAIVLQHEMDSLVEQYSALRAAVPSWQYGFVPAERTARTYVTANFLHGSWLHLIGNMWFLWLAGVVLEDTWGRILYSVFYLIAGAAAMEFYACTNSQGIMPLIGRSRA